MKKTTVYALTALFILLAMYILGTQLGCVPQQTGESKEADDLKDQIEKAKADCDEKMKQLKSDNEAMKAQLDEMGKTHTTMQELIDQLHKQQAQAEKRLGMLTNMLSKFKSLIAAGKLRIKIRNGKMVLVLPSAVLFKSGKANLSKGGEETLSEVAPVLASIEGREFQVAGHTDDQPILKSEFTSNWQLSTARALSVVQFLQDKGVPPENLSAAGYSEYQPVAKNVPGQGKGQNRRIEIILMPNLDELPDLKDLEKILSESGSGGEKEEE
jgi:chemotaxis protein MotB